MIAPSNPPQARNADRPLEESGNAEKLHLRAVLLFFIQVAAYSALIYMARLRWPDGGALGPFRWTATSLDFAQMWSVGLAGVIAELATKGTLQQLGLQTLAIRFWLLAVSVPLAYCTAIYVPCWFLGVAPFKGAPTLLFGMAATALHAPSHLLAALGEEIGWRGSATPNLARATSPNSAGLTCGLTWAVWHYGDILFFGYDEGVPPVYAIACFTIMVVGLGVFLSWLRLASGSVWPPTIFHSAHNLLIYELFERATPATAHVNLITSEFGAGMAVAGLILGVVGWRRQRSISY